MIVLVIKGIKVRLERVVLMGALKKKILFEYY